MEYNDTNLLALDAQGLSFTEIGRELGVSRNTVGGRLHRLRRNLEAKTRTRRQGVHPQGKTIDYDNRSVVLHDKNTAEHMRKIRPNKQTVAVRPHKYKNPTKAEMYADLKRAVENTK